MKTTDADSLIPSTPASAEQATLDWRTASKVPSSLPLPDLFLNGVRPGGLVLDVGCGEAGIASAIKERGGRYVGLDPNLPSLRRAVPSLPVVQGAGGMLPFASKAFDLVLLRAVLTVVPEREALLAVLREALRVRRGRVGIQDFLQTWDLDLYARRYQEGLDLGRERGVFPVRQDGKLLYWARHFTTDGLIELIREAGGRVDCLIETSWPTRSGNIIGGFALLATDAA